MAMDDGSQADSDGLAGLARAGLGQRPWPVALPVGTVVGCSFLQRFCIVSFGLAFGGMSSAGARDNQAVSTGA